mmetsp:Transcript_34524/g.38677  ORF Transcript_34524/g.38677 Transcript_34524/m.38677 type:complete len:795 (-) Transcript_34524:64-2448(-)
MTIMTRDDVPPLVNANESSRPSKPTNSNSNTVTSRNAVRRKTVRRANSGGPLLSSVRRGAEKVTTSISSPNNSQPSTPQRSSTNRRRIRTRGLGPDDGSESTTISLKSSSEKNEPQEQEEKNMKQCNSRKNRGSETQSSSVEGREKISPRERKKPSSQISPCTDEGNTSTFSLPSLNSSSTSIGTNKSKCPSSRSSQVGGVTTADDSSYQSSGSKQRSSLRKHNGRGANEKGKRNSRNHRTAVSSNVDDEATATPKSVSSVQRQRVSVSEKEIMQMLSPNRGSPLSTGENDKEEQDRSSLSSKIRSGRTRNNMRRSRTLKDDDDKNNTKRSKSLVDRKGRNNSKGKYGEGSSIKNQDSDTTNPRSGKTEINKRRGSGDSRDVGVRRSNSSGALGKHTRQLRRSSNDGDRDEGGMNRRNAPRRSRSDDLVSENNLDDFMRHNITVSRRKKGISGSKSVASTPTRSLKNRRPQRSNRSSENSSTNSSKLKSVNSDNVIEEGYDEDSNNDILSSGQRKKIHDHDLSDSDVDDNRSVGLDLVTARGNLPQQHLNEKLQLHLTKTDELLYSVFPKHVADALRNGQKVAPENHDIVTIFFSDIVGFTDISSKLDPLRISDLLDRLYNSFDALSDYHDVFKVETIGDAYMAVTNLTKKQPDHCKRITEFAIDAIRVANQTLIDEKNPNIGFVNIRVGFHSGSVVSSVVGTRNPRYCLFGDTVNTASRMESNSQKNRIHCSEASASLLRKQCPKIRIFPRGEIEVKGKGSMDTFWIHTEGSCSSKDAKNGKIRNFMKSVLKS